MALICACHWLSNGENPWDDTPEMVASPQTQLIELLDAMVPVMIDLQS
jgi:hypothetical protein